MTKRNIIFSISRTSSIGLFTLFFSALTPIVQGQALFTPSLWQGKIGSVRLILAIDSTTQSQPVSGHFESPDQTDDQLPISNLRITADSLVATSSLIRGTFSGRLSSDQQSLVGVWQQGKIAPIPLTLRRSKVSITKSKRPQTPRPPFPYRSDSVSYANADGSIRFGATLTRPDLSGTSTSGRFPTVILITGSGAQDRDETIFRHKPFAVIADHLTRNGFAVLRVDDRGVGQTTGSFLGVTSADFAQDVLAGVAYLKTRSDVDPKRIGLIGHSDGGLIAPLAAVQSPDVAYIVSLAGVGVKGSKLLKKQMATDNRLEGMSPSAQAAMSSLMNDLIDRVADPAIPATRTDLDIIYKRWQRGQTAELLSSMGYTDQSANSSINSLLTPWMRYFLAYDPAPVLRQIRIPLLAMNGEKDFQVDAKDNLNGISIGLEQAGNKHYRIVALPGLNHMFQTAPTGAGSEYTQLEETFSPQALRIMTEWLTKEVGL